MSNKTNKPEPVPPKVSVEGNEVVIRLPFFEKSRGSATGQNIVIAGSGGNRPAGFKHKGRPVSYQATVWVPSSL